MVHKGIRVCGPGTGHHKGSTIAAIPYTLQEVNSVTNLQTVVEENTSHLQLIEDISNIHDYPNTTEN